MNFFHDFSAHPGRLFVIATLLPLASFLFLLLVGGARFFARRYRDTDLGGNAFQALGGDTPNRLGAYVATAAIAASFIFCLSGAIIFYATGEGHADHGHGHGHAEAAEKKPAEQQAGEEKHEGEHAHANLWAEHVTWMTIRFARGERPATNLTLGYYIDHLSIVMFLMVTFIATLIHLFSSGYMSEELQETVEDHQVHGEDGGHYKRRGRYGRFFLFLSLFCFSMLNLILADNLFQVFLSWELVGICSFLLIGFYFERQSASNAANKAFITNRVGDAGFILGVLILWTYVGTLNFQDLFQQIRVPEKDAHGESIVTTLPKNTFVRAYQATDAPSDQGEYRFRFNAQGDHVILFPAHAHAESFEEVRGGVDARLGVASGGYFGTMPYWMLVVAGLGIFLGCVGKSAQFPLHVWLPDAMEGPTPVSALIHAATMVAAGVYLVGRCYPLFTPEARLVIAYTGGITLFVAATIALVMTDIKKVLAYSTVSQLGYMMLALGVGGWAAGLFHLVTHAFFKALLFLGSGSVIYGCHHEQEMTKMGGLRKKMPVTAYTMLVGVLAIAGIPGFSGWYSKDAILGQALGFSKTYPEHTLLFLLPLVTAGLTTFYMFRMWFMTFTGEPRNEHVYEHAHETPWQMTLPLVVLAVFSVIVGWGWPFFSTHFPLLNAEASQLEHELHHAMPASVRADFAAVMLRASLSHELAGNLALGVVVLGIVFASAVYLYKALDPADAREQFPGVYRFLAHKWYFDELYSAALVRPALAVARWCKAADNQGIDKAVDNTAKGTVWLSQLDGKFDNRVVDGLANLLAQVSYAFGGWFRTLQTGYLRSYILFLVLAAVGIYVVLRYFVNLAAAQ